MLNHPTDQEPRRARTVAMSLLLCYVAFLLLNLRAPKQLTPWGYKWAARATAAACHALGTLLGIRFTMKFGTVPPEPCLACVSPHGVFPLSLIGFGMWKFVGRAGSYSEPDLVKLDARAGGASILFRIPILRELLLLANVRDAAQENLVRLLATGRTVAVNPGGNWEMTNMSHTQERIYVQKRLGFIVRASWIPARHLRFRTDLCARSYLRASCQRLAMQTGRPLLPAYAFGESQLYRTYSFLKELRLQIVRKYRIGVPLFTGRWGLPLPLPIPTDVTFVVGDQIPVGPPNADPSDDEVDAVFERYVDEMCRLFTENAPKHLPTEVAARGLEVHRIGHGLVRHVHCKL